MFASLIMSWLGCSEPPATPQSGVTVAMHDGLLWSVNPWDGTLVTSEPTALRSRSFDVGGAPAQVAVADDWLWVTQQAHGTVAIFDAAGGSPELVERIDVGPGPVGLATGLDGSRMYVAVSGADAVVELDTTTLDTVRRFEVGEDPRWIVAHPSGESLFVAYGHGDQVTRIDLEAQTQEEVQLPAVFATSGLPMAARATGNPIVSPKGDELIVPTLYVNHLTPGWKPGSPGVFASTVFVECTEMVHHPLIGRFNPVLTVVPLERVDGTIDGEPTAVSASSHDAHSVVRGPISALAFGDQHTVWATMETANAAVAIDLRPLAMEDLHSKTLEDLGLIERAHASVRVGNGPTGIGLGDDGRMWIHLAGDRRMGWLDPKPALKLVDITRLRPQDFVRRYAMRLDGAFDAGSVLLSPEVEEGRRIFMSAEDGRVTKAGSGLSCSVCHMDGATDGLSWEGGDTPSLLDVERDTVVHHTLGKVADPLRGIGLTEEEATHVARFLRQLRDVKRPTDDLDPVPGTL